MSANSHQDLIEVINSIDELRGLTPGTGAQQIMSRYYEAALRGDEYAIKIWMSTLFPLQKHMDRAVQLPGKLSENNVDAIRQLRYWAADGLISPVICEQHIKLIKAETDTAATQTMLDRIDELERRFASMAQGAKRKGPSGVYAVK